MVLRFLALTALAGLPAAAQLSPAPDASKWCLIDNQTGHDLKLTVTDRAHTVGQILIGTPNNYQVVTGMNGGQRTEAMQADIPAHKKTGIYFYSSLGAFASKFNIGDEEAGIDGVDLSVSFTKVLGFGSTPKQTAYIANPRKFTCKLAKDKIMRKGQAWIVIKSIKP